METKNIILNINKILKSKESRLSINDRERLIVIREKIANSKNARWLLHWLALLVEFLISIFK
jgi:hypothetical protein